MARCPLTNVRAGRKTVDGDAVGQVALNHDDQDDLLMKRIAQGHPRAMRELTTMAGSRLYAFAARILGNNADAEDVTQEAVIRAVRYAPRWQSGTARLDTWLHAVVLNLCRDRLRKRQRTSTAEVPDSADAALNPEEALIESERGQQVSAAIGQLPERQREAIMLVHYQDMNAADAARVLDISIEALESLLARGRRSLKQELLAKENRI
ncbi:MAG: RNA polymerase sigma factor [Oxalobacteraceae bacterium]|nr:MAG: RNA polymerase sigma factor [Oxalobacteraceae bacterium]